MSKTPRFLIKLNNFLLVISFFRENRPIELLVKACQSGCKASSSETWLIKQFRVLLLQHSVLLLLTICHFPDTKSLFLLIHRREAKKGHSHSSSDRRRFHLSLARCRNVVLTLSIWLCLVVALGSLVFLVLLRLFYASDYVDRIHIYIQTLMGSAC